MAGMTKHVLKNRNTRFEVDEVTFIYHLIILSYLILFIILFCSVFNNTMLVKMSYYVLQVIAFRDANSGNLNTAAREVKQAIEKGEANFRWMQSNYEDIFRWLKERNRERDEERKRG